jgi:hypothetical protein
MSNAKRATATIDEVTTPIEELPMPIDVTGHFVPGTTLVTIFVNPAKPVGPEGFVRVDDYCVTPNLGPLPWQTGGKKTLTSLQGGHVDGGRCLLGVCAERADLELYSVVSTYRAPAAGPGPESPFVGPNPRRNDTPLICTHRILNGGPPPQPGQPGPNVFFYPILVDPGHGGNWHGEQFLNKGNYFYTVCVRIGAAPAFHICDPEMEIGPP